MSQLQQLAAEAVNSASGLERHFESSSGEFGARFKAVGFSQERKEGSEIMQQWHE